MQQLLLSNLLSCVLLHFSAAEIPFPASLGPSVTVKDSCVVPWKVAVAATLPVHLHPTHGLYLYVSPGCCRDSKAIFNFGQESLETRAA